MKFTSRDKAIAQRVAEILWVGNHVEAGDEIMVADFPSVSQRLRGETNQPAAALVEQKHLDEAARIRQASGM